MELDLNQAEAYAAAVRAASDPEKLFPGSAQTLQFLHRLYPRGLPKDFVLAEVGCWIGNTSLQFARMLNDNGTLHLFDYSDLAESAARRVVGAGYHRVVAFGCSREQRDSFNWPLMRLLVANPLPIYDYVYLDGTHVWETDGFAFFLLDRLLKVGGFIDLDDYYWTMERSPTQRFNARNHELYTEEQMAVSHVMLIVELLIKRDPRYLTVVPNKVFRKVAP